MRRPLTRNSFGHLFPYLMIAVFALSFVVYAPHAQANVPSLTSLQPYVTSSFNISQITNLTDSGASAGQDAVTANIHVQLTNSKNPVYVWMVSTTSENCGTGSGVIISVDSPVAFNSWTNQTGEYGSHTLTQLRIQAITQTFPKDSVHLVLYVGSNISIHPPIVTTSIPTYKVVATSSDFTNKSVPILKCDQGYVQQLVANSNYTSRFDIYLSHSSGFQTFVEVANITPYIIAAISFIFALLFGMWRSRLIEYAQGYITLLLFIPVFNFGISQLVPSGDSFLLQNFLASMSNLTAWSFVVIVLSPLAILVGTGLRRLKKS